MRSELLTIGLFVGIIAAAFFYIPQTPEAIEETETAADVISEGIGIRQLSLYVMLMSGVIITLGLLLPAEKQYLRIHSSAIVSSKKHK